MVSTCTCIISRKVCLGIGSSLHLNISSAKTTSACRSTIVGKKEIGTRFSPSSTGWSVLAHALSAGRCTWALDRLFISTSSSAISHQQCGDLVRCVGNITTNNVCMTPLMMLSLKGMYTSRSIGYLSTENTRGFSGTRASFLKISLVLPSV